MSGLFVTLNSFGGSLILIKMKQTIALRSKLIVYFEGSIKKSSRVNQPVLFLHRTDLEKVAEFSLSSTYRYILYIPKQISKIYFL